MATALPPLTTGELLDRAFSLYRWHFALFLGIFALPHLAVLAFQCLRIVLQRPVAQLSQVSTAFAWTWGILLLILIASAASQAATVVAVSNVYLGRPAGITDSFSKVKGQIAGIVGLSLSIGLLIGLGFIALIVPGVLLAIRWSLAIPVKVLEGKGVGESMSRSSELTKGNRGRIFVIWLLFTVLSFGVAMLLQWPVQIAAGSARGLTALAHAAPVWRVVSRVVGFTSTCLVGPLATIAFALVYYDERVRKEAFDLQLMMATIDGPALQVAPA